MIHTLRAAALLLLMAAGLLAGCDGNTSPAGPTQTVEFRLAATSAAAPATVGPLTLTAFRVVVGGASLGSGGGDDDGEDDDAGETEPAPALVDVPLDGGTVAVATEEVRAGTYTAVEIEVVRPTTEILARTAGWLAGQTMEVRGEFAGRAFTLPLAIAGEYVQQLPAPVVVEAADNTLATIQVGLTLPVTTWFAGPGGPLDPTDPAQRATIEANARGSFTELGDDD